MISLDTTVVMTVRIKKFNLVKNFPIIIMISMTDEQKIARYLVEGEEIWSVSKQRQILGVLA